MKGEMKVDLLNLRTELNWQSLSIDMLKVGFLQKVMAKVSNLSNRHACEPKIVPEHLFPVCVINKLQVIL